MDACRKFGTKLVSVSKPNYWINPYTITKIAVEGFIEMYRREFGVEATIVKWFNVYGGRQPLFEAKGYRKAVPTWIMNAFEDKSIEIYGNGEQTMDLVYVTDVVEATLAVVEHWHIAEGETFEIGSGEEISANQLARVIKEQTGSFSEIIHIPMRPGETDNTRIKANLEKISTLLAWKPQTSIEIGMKHTIDWYRHNVLP